MNPVSSQNVRNSKDVSHLPLYIQQEYLACCGVFFLAKNNSVLFLALATLWINTIGFVYNTSLYKKFGVSYVDFSAPSDFLLAAIQNPYVIAYAFFFVAFYSSFFLIVSTTKPKPINIPRNAFQVYTMRTKELFNRTYKIFPYYGPMLVFVLVTFMFPWFIGAYTVAPGQQTRPVTVHCEMYNDGKRETVKIQGHIVSSTSSVYLIDPPLRPEFEGQPVSIVPRACVKRIDIPVA